MTDLIKSKKQSETSKRISSWELIDTYMRDNPYHLVRHHLDSFDDFFFKGIPNVFKENNPITILKEPIPNTNSYEREVRLYLGGKDGNKIYYGKPIIYDGETNKHYMYPNMARLRNMTYACSVHYDVDIDIIVRTYDENDKSQDIKEKMDSFTLDKILLGRFPIMLQSKLCLLHGLPKEARYNLGECRNDPGGYFIIDGKEKVIVSQETFGDNMLYIKEKVNDQYSHSIEIRTLSEDSSKPKRTFSIRIVADTPSYKGGQIVAFVPNVKKPLPIFILMRALGIISDKSILEMCLLDIEKEYVFKELFIPSIHDAGEIFTQEQALEYIATLVKNQNISSAMEVISHYLLPNVGTTNFLHKAYTIGYMVKRLLNVYVGKEAPTDRDSFRYKRVHVSGLLLYDLFKEYYKLQIRNIRTKIDTKYYFDPSYRDNMQALIYKNSIEFFKDRIVEDGFRKAYKGRWGSQEYTSKDGVVQSLNRLSFFGFLAHLRKVNLNMDSSAKVVAPRYLHSTQWGIICPVHTPDGGNVGFHKHLAIGAYITSGMSGKPLIEWLKTQNVKPLETLHPNEIYQGMKVFVNGTWIGSHFDPVSLINTFKMYRRHGMLSNFIHVLWDIRNKDIHFATDGGRLCRPVYYIDEKGIPSHYNERFNEKTTWPQCMKGFMISEQDLDANYESSKIANTNTILSLKNNSDLKRTGSIVEYIDTLESEGALIAMKDTDVHSRHTHIEIHPSLVLSILGNMVIFPENNQLPRDLFSCGQTKQAGSVFSTNVFNRIDTMSFMLNYGQNPIVKSRYYEYVTKNEHPYGENVIVAIGCYSGYNVEDALVFNEGSIKRGLFRTSYYKMYEERETSKDVDGSRSDSRFMSILDKEVLGTKPGYDYSRLNDKGVIEEGTPLHDKLIMIGKGLPSEEKVGVYTDASVPAKKGQIGFVDKAIITDDESGFRIAKIRVREDRVPMMGDKFCSRAGQKGTIGIILPEEDMPFTEDGIRPDVIVNPHAIPSRMTIGHLVECIIGKACVYQGGYGDCTAFETEKNKHDMFGQVLMDAGYHSSGNQLLYSGITGSQLEADIFFGPNYYLRLKHMVKDKINYRERGPRTNLTRQTVKGRSNDGGLRIGEMERDCLLAHGMSQFIKDSMMNRGDKYKIAVCNHTGMIAVYNEVDDIFYSPMVDGPLKFDQEIVRQVNIIPKPRHISRFGRSFSVLEVPYCFKLFIQEIAIMNVQMYIITDNNIDKIDDLVGREGQSLRELTGMDTYEEIRKSIRNSKTEIDGVNSSDSLENVRRKGANPEMDGEIERKKSEALASLPKRRLAIIVPYYERDMLMDIKGQNRADHLKKFVDHMREFIPRMKEYAEKNRQVNLYVDIYVIEQNPNETGGSVDETKFNRGALLNAGYLISKEKTYPVVVFHDVDLLPSKRMVPYYVDFLNLNITKKENPYRIAHYAYKWGRYEEIGERFIGGVLGIQSALFEELNGFPNYFEGWGGEDEAFLKRLEKYIEDRDLNVQVGDMIYRPPNIAADDYVDLEGIETMKEKNDLMLSNAVLVNQKIPEGLELDKRMYKLNGLRKGAGGENYEKGEVTSIQNQENMKRIKVNLIKNMTSFDIVSSGSDSQIKEAQRVESEKEKELEEGAFMDSDDEDDEPKEKINIMENVKLPDNEIQELVETKLPNLTMPTLEEEKRREEEKEKDQAREREKQVQFKNTPETIKIETEPLMKLNETQESGNVDSGVNKSVSTPVSIKINKVMEAADE